MSVTFRSFWNVWHARTAGYAVTTVNMLLVSCCETSRCQLRRQWDEAFGRYMRYKLAGCNYDLYEEDFRKLNEKEEKLKFLMLDYPGAQIVPYGADTLTAAAVQSGVRRSRLPAPTSTIRVKSVSCGGGHTCAITEDGTLWSWGYDTLSSDWERGNG